MPDAVEFLKVLKKAAVEAVGATKPVEICFGVVVKASPIKIQIDQKMILGEAQLVFCRNVTDYKVDIFGGNTQDFYYSDSAQTDESAATSPVNPSHVHAIGKTQITVHNGLGVGERVILLRQQGGQKYIVVGRIE